MQDAYTSYSRAANFSAINTVAQVLLQPDEDRGFQYVWQRSSEAGSMSRAQPFVVNGRAPCCVDINPRLQAAVQKNCNNTQGWKHYGINLSGQLMAACQLEEVQLSGNPDVRFRVKSAFFNWFGDDHQLEQTELAGVESPWLLMLNSTDPKKFGDALKKDPSANPASIDPAPAKGMPLDLHDRLWLADLSYRWALDRPAKGRQPLSHAGVPMCKLQALRSGCVMSASHCELSHASAR